MGNDTSLPLSPVRPGFSTMCLTFQCTDRITVLHLDDAGLSVIRKAIRETWSSGIQAQETRCGSGWSFKLSGCPFKYGTGENFPQTRQMVCRILERLYRVGWKINNSSGLGRFQDKSTLFFQRFYPELSSRPFLCVGLSSTDKLQIVNLPAQLVEPVKYTIRRSWILGIQKESFSNGVLEVKMVGNPWHSTDYESIMAKVLLQNVIATLRRYQWAFYCNVSLKCNGDSLFFCHDSNITLGESSQLCTISPNQGDRLLIFNAPKSIVAMIRNVIKTTWFPGEIQNEKGHHGSWEFKLSGTPWHSTNEESVLARYLVLKILEAMLAKGWRNIARIDINFKSVLVFQKGEPKLCPMMCLSPNDDDTFRLINMPAQMVELFRNTLISRWPQGIHMEKQLALSFGRVLQLKLRGLPWEGGESNSTIHARSFLCNILEKFRQQGWMLYLSADVSAKWRYQDYGGDYPIDVNSWWFVYDPAPQSQPSAPAYGFSFPTAAQQHGIGAPSLSYPPPTGGQTADYGMPSSSLYPQPNEPPPTYDQATGWSGKN